MTTKEQERKALEQIKKIVAGLGENSYVGTALEGCLEIASDNIENDWGCSMKERAETAERKLEKLENQNQEFRLAAQKRREKANELEKSLKQAEEKQLTPNLFRAIWSMAYDQEELNRKNMMQAADMMASFADNPKDIAFTQAVKNYNRAKQKAEEAVKIKPVGI